MPQVSETKLKPYTKPMFTKISRTQVLLDLIEQAEQDKRLAAQIRMSLHQGDSEYAGD
jgi:hypothetical protein